MKEKELAQGVVHRVPMDVQKTIIPNLAVQTIWNKITPLARNEWICWIESAKKKETRLKRIKIMHENLIAGKHRPCCWPGCPHRS
jgi:uncharacterized protein YdeI (YjbR/CyaY-like superfamily)